MAEQAIAALQQQFQTAMGELQRRNVELQTQLASSQQQVATERETRWQEMAAATPPSHPQSMGVSARRLGVPDDFQGIQEAWRDWSAVFRGHAGAAVPRLQRLMPDAQAAMTPIVNAAISDDSDRAASAQLYRMLLLICQGAALNIVLLAGDGEGLEAWRRMSEKYEPKMRTLFAEQVMSILSFSPQGDVGERLGACEREIAIYERGRGKTIDDEAKIGTFLLRLLETSLKAQLLIRADPIEGLDGLQGRGGGHLEGVRRGAGAAGADGRVGGRQGPEGQGQARR